MPLCGVLETIGVRPFFFNLVQKALVAFCGVVTVLCGLRMSVHLGSGFNFKNNSEA